MQDVTPYDEHKKYNFLYHDIILTFKQGQIKATPHCIAAIIK